MSVLNRSAIKDTRSKIKPVIRWRNVRDALPFLLPALFFFCTFILYPLFNVFRLSLMEWNGFVTTQPIYVGFENYVTIFTEDPVFWTATGNSLKWMFLSLTIPTTIGLGIALLLNQPILGRDVFRMIFYLPAVLAHIAVATMWRWMYNPYFGAVNYILETFGMQHLSQEWLGDPDVAIYSVFAASAWISVGMNMVLFLAGLQNVPDELKDAARVDGAGVLQVFRHVTIPALRPTFIIVIAFTMISSLKVFDLIIGMTNGGPAQKTQVLALWSYSQSFSNHSFGLGNAVSTVLLGISLLIVVPYLVWTLKGDD